MCAWDTLDGVLAYGVNERDAFLLLENSMHLNRTFERLINFRDKADSRQTPRMTYSSDT